MGFLASLVLIAVFGVLCAWAIHEANRIQKEYRPDDDGGERDWLWPRRQFFTNGRGR